MISKLKTHELFSLFGNPFRLDLIQEIGHGEACVCHLEAVTQKRQAYISQHLMTLRSAGILITRKEGKFVYYRLADQNILRLLQSAAEMTSSSFELKQKNIAAEGANCVCPKCSK